MTDPSADPVPPPGIEIRPLETVEEVFAASEVLADVWSGDRGGMPPNLLRALAHSGNYAVGLYDGDRLVGASVAFFAAPSERSMHSHITGVLPQYQRQGLGRVLKQHQRAWAFAREVGHITWTFDPLVARNAHFNLRVLGTRVTEYLVNQYGPMDDGVNRGDETDRLLVAWALAAPPVPTPPDDAVVASVGIPSDIEGLRREKATDAASWRLRVRAQFLQHLADGLVVGGFDDARGYLFVRP
ncbi:GNAT family N-acetyltransferase [Microbacterium sp. BK668]|uniref:GNAT family N-acetyltransferase n=1 Tax=Microbacterium sp. BK668 TaxID=2512118 RepID=UPI0010601AA7|nr:GNAT family N-acetyltransferase [Microbacterium sp. BK668]TDN91306.1 putative GNAT superfamily acetyltransferase [Microbacterium sp. BK668]